MRVLTFLGLAASVLAAPAALAADGAAHASSGRYNWSAPHAPGMSGGGHWSGVRPTHPGHRPPATRPPGGWHQGGQHHGGWHGGGNWQGGRWNHVRFHRGHRLPSFWLSPTYFVTNWNAYGFPGPGLGRNWVRYYDDALLVDRNGYVYDSRYDVDWDRYDQGPVPEYDGPDDEIFYGDDDVTLGGRYAAPPPYTLPYPGDGRPQVITVPYGATVVINPPVATTTTTTRTYYETVTPRRTGKARPCDCRKPTKLRRAK